MKVFFIAHICLPSRQNTTIFYARSTTSATMTSASMDLPLHISLIPTCMEGMGV